jgi:putative flippase GtrA
MRKEFAKYFIIGISAFVGDVGSLYILKEWVGLTPTAAVVINQPIITLLVFYSNKRWSFRAEGLTRVQMFRFYILAGFNYIFSIIWIKVMHDQLNIQYIIARTANIALAVTWNFLLYKYWVYRVVSGQNQVQNQIGNVAS